MPLSALAVRNAKPREKPFKLTDEKGLYLLVQPTGSKLWRFNYRFEKKQKTLAIGVYPDIELADARDARDEARKLLAKGADPSATKQGETRATGRLAPDSFETVGRDWFAAKKNSWNPKYAERIMSRLEADAFPQLGHRPINEIEPPEFLKVIRLIEQRGVIDTAKRIKNYCSKIFRFGISENRCQRDPAADVGDALMTAKPAKRRAKVKPNALPQLLADMTKYDGDHLTWLALRFTLLTFVRTSEARFAARPEFERLDSDKPLWRIGPERMKMSAEHLVPLSRQAVTVLREIEQLNPKGDLLFAADTVSGVISENTMLYALYRMGYHSRQTVHGFRGLASTALNDSGLFEPDWIERQLAHVDEDEVRGAYNSALYLRQRTAMMQWWADFIDQQTEIGLLVG